MLRRRPAHLALLALLSTTAIAQAADYLGTDDWPMRAAEEALAEAIGDGQVHDITIYDDRIVVTADHLTDPEQTTDFTWDGLEARPGFSIVNFSALGMGDTEPFALADLPFMRLPEVKAAALAAAPAGATITEIEASQPTDRTSKKLLPLWEVTLSLPDGGGAVVLLTANAQVVEATLPQSATVATGPWLAPETVANTLTRLGEEFGPNAKYLEIMIDENWAHVTMEDPRQAGAIAEFLMNAETVSRNDSMMGMPDPFAPPIERSFTLADIAALNAAMLAELEARTLERMGRDDMTVFRYTISRNTLFMTPEDDRLLVEIRAEAPDQWTGGRIAYDMAGNEADSVLP